MKKVLSMLLFVAVGATVAKAQHTQEYLDSRLDVSFRHDNGEIFPEERVELCFAILGSYSGTETSLEELTHLDFGGEPSYSPISLVDTQRSIEGVDTLLFYSNSVDSPIIVSNLTLEEIMNGEKITIEDVVRSTSLGFTPLKHQLEENYPWADFNISLYIQTIDGESYHIAIEETDEEADEETVGVEYLQELNVLLYPNPATDVVRFKGVTEVVDVVITDISNRTVKRIDHQMVQEVSINDLPVGIYMVTVSTDNHTSTQRLVVE